MLMTLQEFYDKAVNSPPFDLPTNKLGFARQHQDGYSEQSAHLPLLKFIASQCASVAEFGMREGFTTSALALGLGANGVLHSYDFVRHSINDYFDQVEWPCQRHFTIKDIVQPGWEIPEVDFLFVDDLHTYDQVRKELKQHGHKAKKYLGFHDTYSQGEKSLDIIGAAGILPAIHEYTTKGW